MAIPARETRQLISANCRTPATRSNAATVSRKPHSMVTRRLHSPNRLGPSGGKTANTSSDTSNRGTSNMPTAGIATRLTNIDPNGS